MQTQNPASFAKGQEELREEKKKVKVLVQKTVIGFVVNLDVFCVF